MLVEVYKDVETSILRGYMIAQLAYMILGLREFGEQPQTKRARNLIH